MSQLGLTNVQGNSATQSTEGYDTEIALATLRPLLEELISSLHLKNRKGEVIKPEKLIKWSLTNKIFPQPYIEVDQYEDADMLEIASTSANPTEAVNMANKLAELYINDDLGRVRAEYKAARVFIENRFQMVKEEYYKSLYDIKDFKITGKTVDLSLETQNLINKIMTLNTNYEDNERTILELKKNITEAESKLKKVEKFRSEIKDFTQSDEVKSLKTKLSDLLIKVSEKSSDITPEHPDYKQLEKEIETVKDLIKKEAKVVFNSKRFSIDPVYDELSKNLIINSIDRDVDITKRHFF